jgi:hypothetical protein
MTPRRLASQEIRLAVMDMCKASRNSTLKVGNAPQASIIYDKFHVLPQLQDAPPPDAQNVRTNSLLLSWLKLVCSSAKRESSAASGADRCCRLVTLALAPA